MIGNGASDPLSCGPSQPATAVRARTSASAHAARTGRSHAGGDVCTIVVPAGARQRREPDQQPDDGDAEGQARGYRQPAERDCRHGEREPAGEHACAPRSRLASRRRRPQTRSATRDPAASRPPRPRELAPAASAYTSRIGPATTGSPAIRPPTRGPKRRRRAGADDEARGEQYLDSEQAHRGMIAQTPTVALEPNWSCLQVRARMRRTGKLALGR